jgi:hypothetical protein
MKSKDYMKVLESLGFETTVAITIWQVGDVLGQAENVGINCSKEEAEEILREMSRTFDATIGMNWDVIDSLLDNLDNERRKQ